MAGKADLVNSIVDSATAELQSIPVRDGWKPDESYVSGIFPSAQSETPPEGESVRIGGRGDGGGN
jgi:hypothetical protein